MVSVLVEGDHWLLHPFRVKEYPKAVVLEISKATTGPLHLRMRRFNPSVGPSEEPVSKWARISSFQAERVLPRVCSFATPTARFHPRDRSVLVLEGRAPFFAHLLVADEEELADLEEEIGTSSPIPRVTFCTLLLT